MFKHKPAASETENKRESIFRKLSDEVQAKLMIATAVLMIGGASYLSVSEHGKLVDLKNEKLELQKANPLYPKDVRIYNNYATITLPDNITKVVQGDSRALSEGESSEGGKEYKIENGQVIIPLWANWEPSLAAYTENNEGDQEFQGFLILEENPNPSEVAGPETLKDAKAQEAKIDG